MKTLLTPTPLIACEEKYLNRVLTELPDGNYSVIGSVDKGVIDFEVEEYLALNPNYIEKHYMSFNHDGMYKNKNKAFLSLITSHSLSLDKKYLIIKPK